MADAKSFNDAKRAKLNRKVSELYQELYGPLIHKDRDYILLDGSYTCPNKPDGSVCSVVKHASNAMHKHACRAKHAVLACFQVLLSARPLMIAVFPLFASFASFAASGAQEWSTDDFAALIKKETEEDRQKITEVRAILPRIKYRFPRSTGSGSSSSAAAAAAAATK